MDLLSDSIERDDWKPNLKRLETLTDAAQMDQRDYAESWAWVYFMLNSPPERRELLTGYLADLRAKGCCRAAFGAAGGAERRARAAADEVYRDAEEGYDGAMRLKVAEVARLQPLDDGDSRILATFRYASFAIHDAFVDFLEAEFLVDRERRRVVLHRLGFDEQDAAVAEAIERLAEQERGESFAALIGRHIEIEHAGGRGTPGRRERFDVPEPHVGQRFAAAGSCERRSGSARRRQSCRLPTKCATAGTCISWHAHFAAQLPQIAGDGRAKAGQFEQQDDHAVDFAIAGVGGRPR